MSQPLEPESQPSDFFAESPLHILVVEDHEDTARLMCQLLRKQNYAVSSATTIQSALAQAELHPIDLLISDLALPDGSGFELMRQLKSRHSLVGIAISGRNSESDLVQSQAAGFTRHLVKPVDFRSLLAEIRTLAQRTRRA